MAQGTSRRLRLFHEGDKSTHSYQGGSWEDTRYATHTTRLDLIIYAVLTRPSLLRYHLRVVALAPDTPHAFGFWGYAELKQGRFATAAAAMARAAVLEGASGLRGRGPGARRFQVVVVELVGEHRHPWI